MEDLYYDILRKKLQFEEQRDYYNERNFLKCKSLKNTHLIMIHGRELHYDMGIKMSGLCCQ